MPIVVRGGERRAAKAADQGVAGTGRQAQPPCEQVPGDCAQQDANHDVGGHADEFGVDQAGGDGSGDGGAPHGADQVGDGSEHDGLARRQDFRGHHRGNGIGSVVKAVYVLKEQRDDNDRQDERHGRSGVFQHDVGDDVADIAATVDDFFEQLVQILQDDDLDGIGVIVVQILVKTHHDPVRFAFQILQLVVKLHDLLEVGASAEIADHFAHGVGGLLQKIDLAGEINVPHLLRGEEEAFGEFLDGFGNAIKGVGKIFDVLALERGDERGVNRLGDPGADLLFLAAGLDELVEQGGLIGVFAEPDERLDTGAGFLGTGFEQVEEHVFLAQQSLEREHSVLARLPEKRGKRTKNNAV